MFNLLAAAFGEPAAIDKSAVFNRHNYDETTTFAGQAQYQVPGAGGQLVSGPLTNAAGLRFPYADFAPVAYCFDAFKGGEQLANDGVSILGQAKKYNNFFYNQEEMSLGFENPKLVLCF